MTKTHNQITNILTKIKIKTESIKIKTWMNEQGVKICLVTKGHLAPAASCLNYTVCC